MRSCNDVVVILDYTYYYVSHWLQWRMEIANIFRRVKYSNYILFLLWPLLQSNKPFSTSIFTFIGGFRKKKLSISRFERKNCWEWNSGNTKTFLLFFPCSSISCTNCVIYHGHVCTVTHTGTRRRFVVRRIHRIPFPFDRIANYMPILSCQLIELSSYRIQSMYWWRNCSQRRPMA